MLAERDGVVGVGDGGLHGTYCLGDSFVVGLCKFPQPQNQHPHL